MSSYFTDAWYYDKLHHTNANYQNNNRLIEELPALRALGGESIIEVGCGNGRFLEQAVTCWSQVQGMDWARSPVLNRVLQNHPGIRFLQQDIKEFTPGERCDLLVSADFLEHLAPNALPDVLRRLHAGAGFNYHKIACYDDGHSHLSIFSPGTWLRIFEEAVPGAGYRIVKKEFRRGNPKKAVVVISNCEAQREVKTHTKNLLSPACGREAGREGRQESATVRIHGIPADPLPDPLPQAGEGMSYLLVKKGLD